MERSERVDLDDAEHQEFRERVAELCKQQEQQQDGKRRRRWFNR